MGHALRRRHSLEPRRSERIRFLCRAVAELDDPVMRFSARKDSTALPVVAFKAFHPGRAPFPLPHVDSMCGLRATFELLDEFAQQRGPRSIARRNEEGCRVGAKNAPAPASASLRRAPIPMAKIPGDAGWSSGISMIYACGQSVGSTRRGSVSHAPALTGFGRDRVPSGRVRRHRRYGAERALIRAMGTQLRPRRRRLFQTEKAHELFLPPRQDRIASWRRRPCERGRAPVSGNGSAE